MTVKIMRRWLATRLELVGGGIVFFAALFAILSRESENPMTGGQVGLSISYALGVTGVLTWMVQQTSEVEANIVAVERLKEYADIVQEAPRHVEAALSGK